MKVINDVCFRFSGRFTLPNKYKVGRYYENSNVGILFFII